MLLFGAKEVVLNPNKHCIPISQMSNYHETLMKRPSLREIDEDSEKNRRPLFGNPFLKMGGKREFIAIGITHFDGSSLEDIIYFTIVYDN